MASGLPNTRNHPSTPEAVFSAPPKLSVVTSLYNSEPTIAEFLRRTDATAAAITPSYEIILVNDGSPDGVRDLLLKLLPEYPKTQLIDLSRNFGQLAAIHAGLTYACGEFIFVLDSDLEEPPEVLKQFYETLQSQPSIDVVYGVQKQRRDPLLRALTSQVFYWFFERMTGIAGLQDMMIIRLMTRRFLNAYLSLGDHHLFVAGLSHHAGFEKKTLVVDKSYKGSSGYTFRKRLTMAADAILSFSTQPLYWLFSTSLVAALTLFFMAISLGIVRLTHPNYQAGWASLVISVWLVGALIINCMAIIGLYIAKVFEQVKDRPRFVVRQIYNSETLR